MPHGLVWLCMATCVMMCVCVCGAVCAHLELDDAADDQLQHDLHVRALLGVHHAVVALLQLP